jgi:hypothetical protein
MSTQPFPIPTNVQYKDACLGFTNNKSLKKHYNSHVLGKGGKFGVGDMAGRFASSQDYEKAGMAFMNSPVGPGIHQVLDRDNNIAKWNSATLEFAVQCGKTRHLLTYHLRDSTQFVNAVFERAVKFYPEGSRILSETNAAFEMGTPNEWAMESLGDEYD